MHFLLGNWSEVFTYLLNAVRGGGATQFPFQRGVSRDGHGVHTSPRVSTSRSNLAKCNYNLTYAKIKN